MVLCQARHVQPCCREQEHHRVHIPGLGVYSFVHRFGNKSKRKKKNTTSIHKC